MKTIKYDFQALKKLVDKAETSEELNHILETLSFMTQKDLKKLQQYANLILAVKNPNIYDRKFVYTERIEECANKYFDQIHSLDNKSRSLFLTFKNEMILLMDEIFQDIYFELKNIVVKTSKREYKNSDYFTQPSNLAGVCAICGETRATNRCHIIPRANGGADFDENMVILCPTHHFLFDQSKLSQEEFERISVDGKAQDSIDYFHTVRRAEHERYWNIKK